MSIKIIKRHEREKAAEQIPAAVSQTKTGEESPTVATTVSSWIVELRQKQENERLAAKALLG